MATAAASRQSACTWRSRLPAAAAYACSSTARTAQSPLLASTCVRAAEIATSIATTKGTGLLTQIQSTASVAVASSVPDLALHLQALTWCAEVKDLIPSRPAIGHVCAQHTGTVLARNLAPAATARVLPTSRVHCSDVDLRARRVDRAESRETERGRGGEVRS